MFVSKILIRRVGRNLDIFDLGKIKRNPQAEKHSNDRARFSPDTRMGYLRGGNAPSIASPLSLLPPREKRDLSPRIWKQQRKPVNSALSTEVHTSEEATRI